MWIDMVYGFAINPNQFDEFLEKTDYNPNQNPNLERR